MALMRTSADPRPVILDDDENPKTIFWAKPLTREEYAEFNLIQSPDTMPDPRNPVGPDNEERAIKINAGVRFFMGTQITRVESAAFELDHLSEDGHPIYELRNLDTFAEINDFLDGLLPLDKQELENKVFNLNAMPDDVKKRLRDTFSVPV